MSKFINKDAMSQKNKRTSEVGSLSTLPDAGNANIKIIDRDEWLEIRINKEFLNTSSNFDIQKYLSIATSPFFTNENKQPGVSNASPEEVERLKAFPRVAFFVESIPHYTGGRYSTYMYALLLSQFTRVTWVCNERPIFEGDFKDYNLEKLNIAVDRDFLINSRECEFDIVVGTPVLGGSYAFEYSKKFKLPLYSILFESPNWISQFREGVDSDESFWKGYKKILKASDLIITPSEESRKHLKLWDEAFVDKNIQVIYPPINELAIRQEKAVGKDLMKQNEPWPRYEKHIVYCTRMAPFKNPSSIIKRIGSEIGIHIIGKVWSDTRPELEKMDNVFIYDSLSDADKFRVINNCDVMIFPTTFEGAGMPPAEALRFGVPVIANELPVLKEIYEGHIYYAKNSDPEEFITLLRSILNDPPNMIGVHSPRGLQMDAVSERMRTVFGVPSITAGIIHYDCYEYLEYAIAAIYPVVSKIILVNGKVEGYPDTGNNGVPVLRHLDPLNKIEIVDGKWADKVQMQNEIAKRVDTEYYVKVDADEIWDPSELAAVVNYLEENPEVKFISMPFDHFWTNFKTVARDAGGKWGTKHPRVWRWNKGMHHFKSFNYFVDSEKERLPIKSPYYEGREWMGGHIAHFGWARPLDAGQKKLNYYENRGIETYSQDNYTVWKKLTDPTMCTQAVRSWAEVFDGKLPRIMKSHPWIHSEDIRKEIVTT